jgi:hypothetical protein
MDLQTKLKLINNYLENECANIQWREMMSEYRQYLMSLKAEAKQSPDDPVTCRQILEEAITAAYRLSAGVKFANAYSRSDIGQRALKAGK